jgi:homocysteine S-methyltransferase
MCWDEMLMGIVDRARGRGGWKSILVGGCCKTTPLDIAKLRKRIDEN